jgi:CRISPR-associated endonuclease/helicase Cas3
MLKACYRLRGYEAIMSDFFSAAFIFDEIHAYEPKRLALILALVGHLKRQYGARFFVMSATFPDLIKTALREQLGAYAEITATSMLFQEFQRHQLHLLPGDVQEPHYIKQIANEATRGRSVLVCCNTVTRAQETWQMLRNTLGADATIVLLHSRLNGRDRLDRENIVRLACGVESAERRPVVVIATQVVEVSLNIDLDTIYTDLAPLEALIQRFGRINRSRRRDADGKSIVVPVYVFREPIPEKDDRPYKLSLLHGTLRLLEEQDGNIINESAVSDWLNTIYNDYAEGYAVAWQEEYAQAIASFEDDILRSLVAFDASQELQQQFYAAFESIDVLPQRFEQEYFGLMSSGLFVEADSLMVSIPYWRYGMLARAGKVRPGDRKADDPLDRVTVAMARYDDDMGLVFDE